ncbi:hypothetical protein NDU88_007889 [Pleurodeles waltl]|uniref:Uncharacterized protein n=1 Tax=Pleurodeles waltl TaxID=8319 RepID=A0AAV7NYP6_PLEWA|nr:hypothetical protein NDU88_007889 [Pleurodeles waltl]
MTAYSSPLCRRTSLAHESLQNTRGAPAQPPRMRELIFSPVNRKSLKEPEALFPLTPAFYLQGRGQPFTFIHTRLAEQHKLIANHIVYLCTKAAPPPSVGQIVGGLTSAAVHSCVILEPYP